ncbi:MAG TPA: hypothetical protein VNX25_04235 [Verrucomicrobiae bacterium]|nr:hypothetical protein [Verrucomicrobiae bacterium]
MFRWVLVCLMLAAACAAAAAEGATAQAPARATAAGQQEEAAGEAVPIEKTAGKGAVRPRNPPLNPAPPGSSRLAPGREVEQHIHDVGEKARSLERNLQDLQPSRPAPSPPVRERGRPKGIPETREEEKGGDGTRIFLPSELQGKPTTLDELRKELEEGR